MQIKSVLKRLLGTNIGSSSAENTRPIMNRGQTRTTVRRSEITSLFQTALDEKQNDLSMRRPGNRS